MSKKQSLHKRSSTLLLLTALLITPVNFLAAQPPSAAEVLKGNIREDGFRKPEKGPSLNRNDMKEKGDPFANDQDLLEPPKGAFEVETAKPPEKPFNLQAQDENQPFQGQNMPGVTDEPPAPIQEQQPMPLQVQQDERPMNPNDPDNSEDMQLAWDIWHRRVAEAIFIKVSTLAGVALKRSQPLVAQVSYAVARDGRVGNIRLNQRSSNPIYNAMIVTAIQSMQGSPLLQYPQGSRRMMVEKQGTFQHNCGPAQGFTYTMGDRERVRQGGR